MYKPVMYAPCTYPADPCTFFRASEVPEKEQKYLERQWQLLTGKSSWAGEVAKYCSDPDDYQVPLLPWVHKHAGHAWMFVSRKPGQTPSLLHELTFISHVMHICLQPGVSVSGAWW